MKKILVLLTGLAICYPLYYFVAHNNGILSKIPFAIVALVTWYLFITGIMSFLREKSYYSALTKLFLALTIALSIITYGIFDRITFGSIEEQEQKLEASGSFANARIVEIDHFDPVTIKRKEFPEHWEVKYEFEDSLRKSYSGTFNLLALPTFSIGDTVLVKYVKDAPEINKRVAIGN